MSTITSFAARFGGAVAIAAAFAAPLSVQAQATTIQPPRSANTGSEPALTREQVRQETERAMRDGTWRCRTNNRGWCSNERLPRAMRDAQLGEQHRSA